MDALYFNKSIFKQILEAGSHVLIKAKKPDFRDVFKEAKLTFQDPVKFEDEIIRAEAFDSKRLCQWKIEVTDEIYCDHKVQVAHLIEYYPKRKHDDPKVESCLITQI